MVNSPDLLSLLGTAISRAQQHLLSLQSPDGYWLGELVVDSTLCSDYVAFMHWAQEVDPELEAKCIRHILSSSFRTEVGTFMRRALRKLMLPSKRIFL